VQAQPQKHISEVTSEDHRNSKRDGMWRHSYLLYRRLFIDLAIHVRSPQTAAEVMSHGLRIDGFVNGGLVGDYLFVPGIWDVMPILVMGGKEWNPYYITKEDTKVMVAEVEIAIAVKANAGQAVETCTGKGWLGRVAE
jgi:hypothetical protein